MKNCNCGPQSYPLWLRKLITKFVGYNNFCKIHDYEYMLLSKVQADRNFIRFLASKGVSNIKLQIISFALLRGGKFHVKRSNLDKKVKQSVFLADLIFTRKDGKVHLIGGKVDENEATFDAFKREFFEETGLKLMDKQISYLFYNTLDVSDVPDVWNQNFFTVENLKIDNLTPSNEVEEIFVLEKNEFLNMNDEDLTYAAQAYKRFLLNDDKQIISSR